MRKRDDIDRLHDEIRELVDDLWQVPRFVAGRRGFRPNVDCIRSDDPATLNVIVELPGVDPSSVEVVVAGRALTVSGERTRPKVAGAHYLAMEIEYGTFQRRIELGVEIDPTNVEATYDKGMLRVVLPISPKTRDEKVNIEVKRA